MPDPRFRTTTELIAAARATLSQPHWDYIAGGALTETSMLRNRESIDALAFRPRVLHDVATTDASATLLGAKLRIPFLLAPVGNLNDYHPDGTDGVVRAAVKFGTLPVVGSLSTPDLAATANAAAGPKWFQLYTRGDMDWIFDIVRRVRDAGYGVLAVTVDSAYFGLRERLIHGNSQVGGARRDEGRTYQASLTWDMVKRIKERAGIPVVLKGIQTGEDAELAVAAGFDAVWISNHGGRELDHCRGSIEMLNEIVPVAAGRVPVIVDGGFYRGTDVVKALALGASAVANGRIYTLALAADGEAGVLRCLEIIEGEMKNAMGLLGVTTLAGLSPNCVAPSPYGRSTSPFPVLPVDARF
jgi:isopentenyl diphosphate isomerase/L-lactate dehydrogenase-like FMN-dependent dehydrogenase